MYLFMKKLFLAIAFLTLGMSANAQGIISDLDEEILIGTWGVTDMIGQFSSFNHEDRDKTVTAITFADGNYTTMTYADGSTTMFKGFWVSRGQTEKYYLHLAPWNGGNFFVNFRILQFSNGIMQIASYDYTGTMTLVKEGSSGIRATRSDATGGKAYRLNGTPATESDKGIVIQNGKKTVRK
jgi:hypothetical protein